MGGAVGLIHTKHDLHLFCTPSVPCPPHRPSTLRTPAGGPVREVRSMQRAWGCSGGWGGKTIPSTSAPPTVGSRRATARPHKIKSRPLNISSRTTSLCSAVPIGTVNKKNIVATAHSARGARGRRGGLLGVGSGRCHVMSRGRRYAARDRKTVGHCAPKSRGTHMAHRGGFNYENRPLGPLKSVLPTRATHITVC